MSGPLTSEEKRAKDARIVAALREMDAKRVAAGTCRHCGGPIPCWSIFGDRAVGKQHTAKSLGSKMNAVERMLIEALTEDDGD